MSGTGRLYIQPSLFVYNAALEAGAVYTGTPVPGVNIAPAIPPVQGVADCTNLLSASPPTLLEVYELVSYSIALGANVVNGTAYTTQPNLTLGIILTLNNDVVHSNSKQVPTTPAFGGIQAEGNVLLVADIVNPIRYGARDRLGLQVSIESDQAASSSASLAVAARLNPSSNAPAGVASTITYDVLDVPGSRRL